MVWTGINSEILSFGTSLTTNECSSEAGKLMSLNSFKLLNASSPIIDLTANPALSLSPLWRCFWMSDRFSRWSFTTLFTSFKASPGSVSVDPRRLDLFNSSRRLMRPPRVDGWEATESLISLVEEDLWRREHVCDKYALIGWTKTEIIQRNSLCQPRLLQPLQTERRICGSE